MARLLFTAAAALLLAPAAHAQSANAARDAIIRESREAYPGRCPCPYSVMRNGVSCGARSAWSRPGGAAPLCYRRDVSAAMVSAYLARARAPAEVRLALRGRLP